MKLEKINKNNLIKATKVQLEIFGEKECAYYYYLKSFVSKSDNYYLVYDDGRIVGLAGLYLDEFTQSFDPGGVWLDCFGVVKSERRKGYGKQILNKMITLARKQGFKTFRLYTHTFNSAACKLYDQVMDFKEDYNFEKNVNVVIYSKSLVGKKARKLGNRYLGVNWHYKEQEEGLKMFLRESK